MQAIASTCKSGYLAHKKIKERKMTQAVAAKERITSPNLFWLLTDGGRAFYELSWYLPYRLFRRKPKTGDKHPVLVIPGFMSTDLTTLPLRNFINSIGYQAHPWGLGRNYGDEQYIDLLCQQVEDLYHESGLPVSLIGWSLGGVFAREIAKRRPKLTRQVITLGSPFAGISEPNNANWLFKLITEGAGLDTVSEEFLLTLNKPAPVPTTAIYSKEDGIVNWKVCMEEADHLHQNIQVRGSHLGFGVNPIVMEIISDRLSFSKKNWRRYVAPNVINNTLFIPAT